MIRRKLTSVLVLAAALAACGESITVPDTGQVRFVLSNSAAAPAGQPALSGDRDDDHPEGRFVSANVTFTSVLARSFDGVLENITMELPTTLDVMSLEERGRSVALPDGELPPGTYDQVVVVMSAVQVVTRDGTTITVEPPGGGWTAIIPVCPFDVEDGATAVVGLELSVRHAFAWRNGGVLFRPHFRCDSTPDDDEPAG